MNLKTEIMIEDLYDKMNLLLAKQAVMEKQLKSHNEVKSDAAANSKK